MTRLERSKDQYPFYAGAVITKTSDNLFILKTHQGQFQLKGPKLEMIFKIMSQYDGSKSLYDSMKQYDDEEKEQLMHTFDMLSKMGAITYLDERLTGAEEKAITLLSYFAGNVDNPLVSLKKLKNKVIFCIGTKNLLEEILHKNGIEKVVLLDNVADIIPYTEEYKSRMLSIVQDDYLSDINFLKFNKLAVTYKIPWIPISFGFKNARLGPWIYPGETACYKCFKLRHLAISSSRLNSIDSDTSEIILDTGKGICFPDAVYEMAYAELVKDIITVSASISNYTQWGHVKTIQFEKGLITDEIVYQLPFCPVCGSSAPQIKRWENEI